MESIVNILIGAFLVFSIFFLVKRNKAKKTSLKNWIFSISAIILIPFGIAWLVTSIGEGEPQAGWLGMIVFSGLGVVFVFLAKSALFANEEKAAQKTKLSYDNMGLKSIAATLLVLGSLTLPIAISSSKLVSEFGTKEASSTLIYDQILSDQSLPNVIKTGLRYENFYGDFPEEMETEVIQCMILGVENDELVYLLSLILPENERFEMYEKVSAEISSWMESDKTYPSFEINPTIYKTRAIENSENMMRWIYSNFELPPLDDEKVELFAANTFSDNLEDYLGAPPEFLKEEMIIHSAGALRQKINETEVPANIDVFSDLKETVSENELQSKKAYLMNASKFLSYFWIISVLLLIAGIVCAFFAKVNLLKWSGSLVLLTGIFTLFYSNQILDIEGIITLIVENAPIPASAIAYHLLPVILVPIGESLFILATTLTVIGIALLFISYFQAIGSYFKRIALWLQGITTTKSKTSLVKE